MKSDIIIYKKNEVYLKLECEPHILYELSPYFTFEIPNAKFMKGNKYKGWNGEIRLLNVHTKEIYVGLLDKLVEKIKQHNYTYEFAENKYYGLPYEENQRVNIDFIKDYMNSIISSKYKPREYQIEAVTEALRHHRKLLLSPTSSGKSMIIYTLIHYYTDFNQRAIIIVPTTSLVEQLRKDFEDYGFDVEENVHTIYSGKSKNTDKLVVISTYQSLSDMDRKYFSQYDVVVVDESHQARSKSITGILHKMVDIKYRFGLTGTLDGTETHKWVLEGLFGPTYKVINTQELMEKGNIAKLHINIIILDHTPRRFETYEDEIQYLITNKKRNNFIKNLALDLKGNTLLLYSRVETHGAILYELINSSVKNDRKVFFVHGGVDIDEREQVRELTEKENNCIIIASYGVFSTGISIKNLHNLVFASPSKSKIRNLQSIGRVLRKSNTKDKAILYDIADNITHHNRKNYTLNHLIERVKVYNEESFNYQFHRVDIKENEK